MHMHNIDMHYLSREHALGDYATLIQAIKKQYNAPDAAVIGFGGSYGGMLAAWFRMKYPHLVDGVVAASAPTLSF
jgi:lysosomal Pro-X carboxypeptidase